MPSPAHPNDPPLCAHRHHQIDLLIDLTGHTTHNRLLALARKPAPIQISYLGYVGTTGLSAMDFRLTDALADPLDQTDAFFTEKLIRLPESAWCFTPPNDVPLPRVARASATQHPIRFASFNYFGKISPQIALLWAQILHRVPGSRLLIKARGLGSPDSRRLALDYLATHGIDPARVELEPRLPDRRAHLLRYQEIDIALDTFPYHGTTTTCEALYMGVPVITLAGQTHASRVGVSLLTNSGVSELIAHSPEEYVSHAISLAVNPGALAEYHQTLRQRMQASALMNAPLLARRVESVYRQLWKDWCRNSQRA